MFVCVLYFRLCYVFFLVCIIYVVVTRNNSRFVCFVAIDDAALNQLVARICRQKEETTSCVIHCFTLRSKKLKHTLSSKTKTTHNTLKTQMFYVFIMCVSVCHCVWMWIIHQSERLQQSNYNATRYAASRYNINFEVMLEFML